MIMRLNVVVWFAVLLSVTHLPASDNNEEPFQLQCSDGFVLDGKIALPADTGLDGVKKVVILIHGSGAQSMDADLSFVTKGGKKNLFFKEVSETLSQAGFAVVRYNKRSYQTGLKKKEDPAFLNSKLFQEYAENPLKFFVDDAKDCVKFCQERFPGAEIFLLGHSQGTYVALQVAHQMPEIKGVALIGFAVSASDVLVFEQTVYRPLHWFDKLDTDNNDELDAKELEVQDAIAASLRGQMAVLDLDSDQNISRTEFKAGNFSNLIAHDLTAPLRKQEALYPTVPEILKSASFKVAFFQGMLDNQTPAYHAKAVELIARHVWKKQNFSFTYFPGLGHVLDHRSGYYDLQFETITPQAKEKLAAALAEFF
ncbi:MAG: alpha/beta fold hydrolase [bacterium]